LNERKCEVQSVDVRQLPLLELFAGRVDEPAIHAAIHLLERADGIVFITPVYKAAYSGMLKAFLDVLPQVCLEGKVVWPIAVGGTLAHLLAIDYALRPVLASMGGPHVVGSLFLLDSWLPRTDSGAILLDGDDVRPRLARGIDQITSGCARRNTQTPIAIAERACA
jgi:FMN reductase